MGIRGNDFDNDAYYADLEKWILKLTADDDEDCAVALRTDGYGYSRNSSIGVNRGPDLARTYAMPCWGSFKKGGNIGTGVFIPQINNRLAPNPGHLPNETVTKKEKGRVRRCRHKGKNQLGPNCEGGDIKIST